MFQKDYWERKALDNRRPPDHPVVRQYVVPKIDFIRRQITLDKHTRLLDVGCGNGFFSYYFDQACEVVGVDFSEKMLAKNPISRKLLMDASHLSFQDFAFDLVFCHALLHHVEDIDAVLTEMRRVSRKYVVILEPNRNNPLMYLFSALVPEERKAMEFSMDYLKERLARNGLKVVASASHGMTVPNKTPAFLLPLVKLL
ncbi:MAG TPA: methyltransferase domain-containing protein, partial [bacterium]|nr:methyltransferase domain-containing protein [bacterium]